MDLAAKWERVDRCPKCNNTDRGILASGMSDLQVTSPDCKYDLFCCRRCQIAYLSPRPSRESILLFYPPEYLPVGSASPGGFQRLWRHLTHAGRQLLTLPYRLRFGTPTTTFKPCGRKRLLEVGFGNGEYLASMQKLGWEVYGCDVVPEKVEHLRATLGTRNAFVGSIRDVAFPKNYFDAVMLWHVIEHLYDPLDDLATISDLLRVGGHLVIGTPNFRGIEATVFGRWWKGYDVPRHLTIFSLESLTAVLQENGFQVQRARPYPFVSSIADSVALFSRGYFGCRIWGTMLHRVIYYLLYPVAVLSYPLGNWSIIEVTAIKVK